MNEVICGNIGYVYEGDDEAVAEKIFDAYVELSRCELGRAGGEDVTWMRNHEPHMEFYGSLHVLEEAKESLAEENSTYYIWYAEDTKEHFFTLDTAYKVKAVWVLLPDGQVVKGPMWGKLQSSEVKE